MYRNNSSLIIVSAMLTGALLGCSSVIDSSDSSDSGNFIRNSDTESSHFVVTRTSARPVDEAIGALRSALSGNDAIKALPVVDYQANAESSGLTLRPTSVQLFGNPALGTPLMQENQLAGLDLPQKILVWEGEDKITNVAYNAIDYLRKRHALKKPESEASLIRIEEALDGLAKTAAGHTSASGVDEIESSALVSSSVSAGEGIVTVVSGLDFDTTYDRLVSAVEENKLITLVAEIDHTSNAKGVGLELNPTRLIVFGNPKLGTPLMRAEQTVGIDLPQKMLVFQNAEGVVTLAYNDPVYLAGRHGISGQENRLKTISQALAGLANSAAGVAP